MSSPAQPASLAELGRAWWEAVRPTAEAVLPEEAVEECFRDQLDRLIDALHQEQWGPKPAAEAGAELVARGFTGEQALGRTIELLGQALPGQPELGTVEGLASKVASLLGALASGYTAALHRRDLQRSEARFREVFDSAPAGMVISRLDCTVTKTNGALTEILQYSPDELTGRDIGELFDPDDAAMLRAAYQGLSEGKSAPFRSRAKFLAANGDTTLVTMTVTVLRDGAGSPTHHVTMVQDVTDVHLLHQCLRHQSLHDLLTGLPNRLHFAIYLEALRERDRSAAVMLCKIDLDCFGVVNDGLGQGTGDLLLRSVAGRLQALVAGERAIVARFGADEFAILIEESPTTPDAASLSASINAERPPGGRGPAGPVRVGHRDARGMGEWATHPALPIGGTAQSRRGRRRPDSGACGVAALGPSGARCRGA